MAKIAFIGLGNMGAPMARNLLKAGHELRVYDIAPAAIHALGERGVTRSAPETVAQEVDAVITMLPAGEDVEQVLSGAAGLFSSAAPGTLFVDCSTIDVQTARSLAEQATHAAVEFVDAPVSGGIVKASDGTLTFMVGGKGEQVERARPILATMGAVIIHAGKAGSGQVAKMCNNMMLGVSMIAVAEAFAMAQKLGLDPQRLLEICTRSTSRCWVMTDCNPVPGLVEMAPAGSNYEPGFTSRLMLKDLRLSQDAAQSADCWTPMGARATELYEEFVESGGSKFDFSAIIRMIEKSQ
jgi:3-hydroxyisobutyrate dehydrogenase